MNQKISVFIIAFNEQKIIGQCLERLKWADEIIVVDSGSTDDTVSICEMHGAKVIYHKFEDYGKQKHFALQQTSNDWVLSLDADELLTDDLISEILNSKFSEEVVGYKIPRTHVFLNRVFKYGSENKRLILRLFNKKFGHFEENKVHEKIIVNGIIGEFKNEMFHYTVSNIATAANKSVEYAVLSSGFSFENGKRTSLMKPIVKIPFEFIRAYLFQFNFLNGYEGFIWSVFSAYGSFLKYAMLLEFQLNEKSAHGKKGGDLLKTKEIVS